MKIYVVISVLVVVLLGVGIAAKFYWQQPQIKPELPHTQATAPIQLPPPAPPQEKRQVIDNPPVQPHLPMLSKSDKFMMDNMTDLVGNYTLMKHFYTNKVIRNIVATIDSLPQDRVPSSVMPIEPVAGDFVIEGSENDITISTKNSARYSSYVKIAELVNAKKLVEAYVRLYPLFQQAYEELGYPKGNFNEHLLDVLDNLLDAPDLKEPVKLIRSEVLYHYADSELESSSAGQKILMRIGSKNEAIIKSKISEIKKQILLNMHNMKN